MIARILAVTALVIAPVTTAESCDNPPQKNPPKVSPGNTTRFQTLDPGTVTARKRHGAKSHWLQIDRNGDRTWGKVRGVTYRRCLVGEAWPACKDHKS